MRAPTITVDRADDSLIACPRSYLGDSFQSYLGVCRQVGARFDKDRKAHRLAPEKLEAFYSALVHAGFNVENTEAVVTMLTERSRRCDDVAADIERRSSGLGLYAYQISGATWLAKRERALLADDMGLGKTVQALIAVPEGSPVIVVCPAAVKGVWQRECARWRPDLRPCVLSGRKSFRWPDPGELLIVNYDILPGVIGEAPRQTPDVRGEQPSGVVLIADEAHMLKNYQSKRAGCFTVLGKAITKRRGRVWLLTGTPLLGRPFDLWGVLGAANLGWDAYGSWDGFLYAFNGRKAPMGGYDFGTPRSEAALGLERVCLRRRKAEVLPDLPKKSWQDLLVDVETGGLEGIADVAAWLDENEGAESIPFEMLSRARAELATAKIPAMLEIVEEFEEAEEPLIVFSAHRAPVLELRDREGWAVITGDQTPDERSAIVARFQAGGLRGVALTIAAGGVGLTLTRASNLLMVDREWTPALNVQAEDRVCRIGQERPVLIKRLIADHPVDRRIAEVLDAKEKLIQATVEAATTLDPTATPKTATERALETAQGRVAASPEPRSSTPLKVVLGTTPEGSYAVRRRDGGVSFWRLDRPIDGKWAGYGFLRQQISGELHRAAMVKPDGTVVSEQAPIMALVLGRIIADPEAGARLYGQEIGACGICGRTLTNETSRAAGIGPFCAAKFGWAVNGEVE